jgi:iron complex outermembrane receptor protein
MRNRFSLFLGGCSLFVACSLLGEDKPAGVKTVVETIVVSGIRADETTPVTKSDLGREDIERDYHGQDIPLLLRETPSINAYAEAGVGGSGYSYISLRGISPTRLNFTLDGVPLADSEDMATYFADFPDLARSLQSIQVQRGVGTSTFGTASFGGSVNMESIALAPQSSTDVTLAAGSYGTRQASAGWQSGNLPGGFAVYARLSADQSDGFRESSGVRAHNFFLSAAKTADRSQLKLTGFTAHERTAQSFLAVDEFTLGNDLRFNPMSPDDRDSFGYDLAQLQYLQALSPDLHVTASAYYQRGYGWYRLFDDESARDTLRQYGLDGRLAGAMATMSSAHGPWSANYGLHVNEFRREHTRDVVRGTEAGTRDYFNYGTKGEANAFAKGSYDAARWHLYGDLQLRTTDFHYHGDVAVAPIRWTFFNPKIGARYALASTSSIYASAGLTTREPARNDLFQGEDNASFAHDLHAVKPERLFDVEAGYDLHTSTATFGANVYSMQFHNEIAATGELSDIGLLLRRNAARSYRRGVELEATWRPSMRTRLRTSASLSHNRIRSWTQYFDIYRDALYVSSEPLVFHNVHPVLTPEVIVSQSAEIAATSRLTFGAVARYTGRSYLDNTDNANLTTPPFFVLDASAALALGHGARLRLQVNNLFDNKRVYASGYSYDFITDGAIAGTPYYYPQATRHAIVTIDWTL